MPAIAISTLPPPYQSPHQPPRQSPPLATHTLDEPPVPALRIVRPEPERSPLYIAAVRAGDLWVLAVRLQAHAQINASGLAGLFAHAVDRAESKFQAAINALHAGGSDSLDGGGSETGASEAAEVHFRAHMRAREALAEGRVAHE